ncbi:MAG: DUF2911 domain-containing protein [Bacteroidota bacterium]|nr:DUF2911 domain-containing protein [Bacteroidota bacterium]
MKKILSIALIAACFVQSNAQIKTPAPSPFSTVSQSFGIIDSKIEYSRPSARGRKIFGDVVPFDKIWRTGANGATKITFSDSVMIGDKKIGGGTYGLFTIPSTTEWTIIISKSTSLWGAEGYDASNDVVRFKSKPFALTMPVETFTIDYANITRTSSDIMLSWENTAVKFTVSTDPDKKIMAQIKNAMDGNDWMWAAANYYHDNDKDMKQALEWVNKVIEKDKDPQFWRVHVKAKILKKMGDCKGASEVAQKSKDLAIAAKNDDYVKLNDKLLAECKGK